MSAVETWFGSHFTSLHPLLQALHRDGGSLAGTVQIEFGTGVAGWTGRRLARALGIPAEAGAHRLQVFIHSNDGVLHWDRRFAERSVFRSTFIPTGSFPEGHWIEQSGALRLLLGVEVIGGGWHWRQRGGRLGGVRLPRIAMPQTRAHKDVVDGLYRFSVAIDMPLLGTVLHYHGNLAGHPLASR